MHEGTLDLIILILVFAMLQIWWIFPLLINNKKNNFNDKELKSKIDELERLFRK